MKIRAAMIAAACAVAACSESDGRVYVPLPPHTGSKSMVVAIQRSGELTMLAADLDTANSALESTFAEADTYALEALLYDRTLTDLSLPSGTLESDASEVEVAAPNAIYTAEIRDDLATTWTRSNAPSERVANFRPKRLNIKRCPTYETAFRAELGGSADHTFSFKLGDEKALIGLLDGTIVVVEGRTVTPLSERPINLPIGSAFIDELGDMYFAGRNGDVWKGRYVETSTSTRIEAVPFASSGVEGVVRFIAGGPVGGGYELFTLDDIGHFERFFRDRWERLYDFGDIANTGTKGGLVRLGAGHVVAASATRSEVVRYRNGVAEVDNPEGLEVGITGVGRTAKDGILVSTGDGYISASSAPRVWTSLGQAKITVDLYTFFEVPTGFLYGGAFGYIAEKNGDEFCPAEDLGAGSIRGIVPYGDGFLLAEDKPQGNELTSVTLLRRLP